MRAKKNTVKRVLRGGGFISVTKSLRVTCSGRDVPESRDGVRVFGFRIVVRRKS